jgi:NADH-quinone oxidoreductase subunit M
VFLAGVLLKMGTFGLLRLRCRCSPTPRSSSRHGSSAGGDRDPVRRVVALMQSDIKRLIAYSSVSHMGFVVLGTFALNTTATSASVVQMVNHGLSTGRCSC